jgi:hypothetical protein
MVRAFVGLCVAGAILAGCSTQNPDSRAYAGSAPDVTLEKALKDNGIKLPEDAAGVRFAVYIGPNENFDLTFDTECGTIPEFLKESSFKDSPKRYVLLPSLVETAGQEHDWKLESYPESRGIEEDRLGSVIRSVIVAEAAGNFCKVFVSALR